MCILLLIKPIYIYYLCKTQGQIRKTHSKYVSADPQIHRIRNMHMKSCYQIYKLLHNALLHQRGFIFSPVFVFVSQQDISKPVCKIPSDNRGGFTLCAVLPKQTTYNTLTPHNYSFHNQQKNETYYFNVIFKFKSQVRFCKHVPTSHLQISTDLLFAIISKSIPGLSC